MRFANYIILVLFISIITGCDLCNKKNKIAEWAIALDGISLPIGSEITVQLKYIDDETAIDSVVYFFNDQRLKVSAMIGDIIKIPTDTLRVGNYKVGAIIYHGKKKENHSAIFDLISDIVPQQIEKNIGNVFPHSSSNFTEGFFFHNGMIYESTGMNGNSFICRYKLGSKTQERLTTLPNEYFGEGSMLYDNKLIQLTWKNGLGLIYDAATLKQTGQFRIGGEGWGLTYDGKNLIMSDGSHRLFYLDKETYAVSKIVEVYDNKGKVLNINELEYIDGIIYANIWQTDKIAKINTTNGKVMAYINCEGLLTEAEIQEYKCDVLNGIAYDPQTKKLYITGKNWPKIFELKLDTIPSHASKETIEVINVKNTIELL